MARGVYSEQDETLSTKPSELGSLSADVRRLLSDARGLLDDQLHLLALEAARAGRALALMGALGVAAGILLAGTGLGLGVAMALWLLEQGLRPSAAVLAASLLDLAGALVLGVAMQRASSALTFPATRKSLFSSNSTDKERTDSGTSDSEKSPR